MPDHHRSDGAKADVQGPGGSTAGLGRDGRAAQGVAIGERGYSSGSRWRSPVRGPWLTSVLGLVLLIGIPIEFVTGLLSYAAHNPRLGANDANPHHGLLGFYLFDWATSPGWLYRLTQGVHVMLGLALVPVLAVKLWSVMPKLFRWPQVKSIAYLLERLSLALLVGGVIFEFSTGILNINYSGAGFSFYTGHFYGAWVFISGFAVHVALKLGRMVRALRSRSLRVELRTGLADTRREEVDDELVAADPARPTISRRGILALVGGTSIAVIALTVGETLGGGLRALALFGTRNVSPGVGPNRFPVNHTAASVGISATDTGPDWRLELIGTRQVSLSRNELLTMPLTTADLPIACTEGWSTTQRWTGIPLADLARRAGVQRAGSTVVESLKSEATVTLSGAQVRNPQSMLALRVNGADLSIDHGFPARVMVPAVPGSYNRKWIRRITFAEEL